MKKTTDIMMWFLLFIALCMGAWAVADVYPPLHQVVTQTGLYQLVMQLTPEEMFIPLGSGQVIMMMICLILLYLGISKNFEPLLLVPIAIGGILVNLPGAGMMEEGGLLYVLYHAGIENGLFPLLIFMGIGAMTDFGPLLANPKTALLGGAAQFAIFGTFLGAIALGKYVGFFDVTLNQAAAISIIGGADGPTSIFLAGKLAPELLGAIAVAAYSYMALVPVIQPPIMRLCTTKNDRLIRMQQLREVSQTEKIIFPIAITILTGLFVPMALPLIGVLMFGNLLKESGVTARLAETAANSMVNIVTIMLGLSVGAKMSAELFLTPTTLLVLMLGVFAFGLGTASGVLMAKFLNLFSKNKINPLIGSAGVSALPMAARVSHKLGLEADPNNHLLMHAMGGNVAGTLGSAIAAGIFLAFLM